MIDTILFDLDGTLLSMDTELFIKHYFGLVAKALEDHMTLEEVLKYFWECTNIVIESTDGSLSNEEVFFEAFFERVSVDKEVLTPILENFYLSEFKQLKFLASSKPEMIEAIEILKSKNYKLVIATNPIFPEAAVLERIQWADINVSDFEYVTTFENSYYTKPNPNYYSNILEVINKKPSECLMVGNHTEEDMISKEVGLSTYLITDHLLGDPNDLDNVDHKGDYNSFLKFVEELPILDK